MRYKNILFVIFFVKEVNSLANCCDECCYNYFGYYTEGYKKVIEDEDTIKNDFQKYVKNAINISAKYEPQTKVLRQFINHYKKSKRMLPKHLEPFLDVLLKIPIENKDLINIMKKELDYETKKEQLEYIDINQIVEVEEIEKKEDKNKRYILKKDKDIILRDLHRTSPNVESFNTPKNLKILEKIIYNFIFQLYKSGINTGYYQGMNIYAGFFLILCEKEDPSGKLAFELLYLFMTKKWWVNDYITGTVIIDEGKNKNPHYVEKKYVEEKYSIISFYMDEFLIIRSINNKICDNMTFLKEEDKEDLKVQILFQSLLSGLRNLDINMIKKIFFLILLVKNCKIFFDIANFAVNFFPPPNNEEEYDPVDYYNKDLFPKFVKSYTK